MKTFLIPETIRGMYMLWFNLILFLCSGVISLKQRKIKFKPRIKLNHNIGKLSAQRSQKSYHSNLVKVHVRESGFRNLGNFVLVESRILRFGIRSTAVGIRNPGLWKPEYSWRNPGILGFTIRSTAAGIRNPGLWNAEYSWRNPESWALESAVQLQESGILGFGMRSTAGGIRNPALWNPKYSWRNPESCALESRVQL